MSNAHTQRVNALKSQGWQEAEWLPAMGITILVRGGSYITVTRNGRVKPGRPENC